MQPTFLPCVFAGSGVSATHQRLWPGAPRAATVQGTRDSVCCTAYSRRLTPPFPCPLGSRRDQGPFQTSGRLWPRTRGKRVHRKQQRSPSTKPQYGNTKTKTTCAGMTENSERHESVRRWSANQAVRTNLSAHNTGRRIEVRTVVLSVKARISFPLKFETPVQDLMSRWCEALRTCFM